MLDFMVIGFPRSGTTWAANWLTADRTFCVHDPLWTMHYSEFDREIQRRAGERLSGISCTGIWRWPAWLDAHPARKLILHRPVEEIRDSLRRIDLLAATPPATDRALRRIKGMHLATADLFVPERAAAVWEYLTRLPFDGERHAELVQMNVQPRFVALRKDWNVHRRISVEVSTMG